LWPYIDLKYLRASSYEPGVTWFLRSRLVTLFLVKISMFLSEKPSWCGCQDLSNWDENFPCEHSSWGDRDEIF